MMSKKVECRVMLKVLQGDDGKWDFSSAEWFRMERIRLNDFPYVEVEVAVPDRKGVSND